jgi:hypothetical protein|tara:strand:- start:4061 stop:4225 length:165 start_codon:yes stop_codon:yes gene_type:complete
MCIICVELIKGKMGSIDAINNMLERIDDFDEKHVKRILDLARRQKEKEEEQNAK